jgi:hypothetical protein
MSRVVAMLKNFLIFRRKVLGTEEEGKLSWVPR